MAHVLFNCFALLTIAGAVGVVANKNTVNAGKLSTTAKKH